MWLIFLIMFGVVIYLVIQHSKMRGSDTTPQETPLDILKKRYASGEISKDEFERIKKDIKS